MNGILIESDVIAEYLTAEAGQTPLLRRLLEIAPCYSTFIQAAEIYSTARDDDERRTVERALFGLKILGASSRYAKTIGSVLTSVATGDRYRTAIVAAMAIASQLPVVTDVHFHALSDAPGITVVSASSLRQLPDREALQHWLGNVLPERT